MSDEKPMEQPKPSTAGIVYGNIVYWGTIVSAVIAMIGLVYGFVTRQEFMSPSYVLSSIWKGESVGQIWEGATGHAPNGHWYVNAINTGQGLTMLGIALGVFVIVPAILASGAVLLKNKQFLFGTMAAVAALITLVAAAP